MLQTIGVESIDELIDETIPTSIRMTEALDLPDRLSEREVIAKLRSIADQVIVNRSLIGMGYYDTVTPPVIQRNILRTRDGTPSIRRIRRRFLRVVWKH